MIYIPGKGRFFTFRRILLLGEYPPNEWDLDKNYIHPMLLCQIPNTMEDHASMGLQASRNVSR